MGANRGAFIWSRKKLLEKRSLQPQTRIGNAELSTQAVEDGQSRYYNRLVDAARIDDRDWKGSELMLRPDNIYRWGVMVEHNWKAFPGGGSCIFMHIWRGPQHGTAACTAMPPEDMEDIVRWLDWQKHPLLVQLPAETYDTMKNQWGLPASD